jgi:hypothetical protein
VLFLLTSIWLSICAVGCDPRNETATAGSLVDLPLDAYRCELLDLAFDAVSAMPVDPHVKNRSRAQEAVVKACLELDQPQRALQFTKQIVDWRRGVAYADLAFYCARRGLKGEVETYLDLADQASQDVQDWRRDRIRVRIAETHAYLGQAQAAAQFEQGVDASESGKVARVMAMVCPPESFDEQMATLASLVATEHFDAVKNALGAYGELYNRFYADDARRRTIEERIRMSSGNLPAFVRIDVLIELVDFSLAHSDQAKACELLNEARTTVESATWQPTMGIPLVAKLSELRFRAGDPEKARQEARAALALFDAKRDQIVNIYRGEMLRSVAEAFQTMGDPIASELYGRAIEAGMENPNSRPRAEDLAATCCAMALHAAQPTPALWNRIREIRKGLGDPW